MKRLMEIKSPIKDPFSMPNQFSTPNDSSQNNKASDTASEQVFSSTIDSRFDWNI